MTKFSLNLGATLLPTEASDNLKRPGKGTNQIYRTDLHIILVNSESGCVTWCQIVKERLSPNWPSVFPAFSNSDFSCCSGRGRRSKKGDQRKLVVSMLDESILATVNISRKHCKQSWIFMKHKKCIGIMVEKSIFWRTGPHTILHLLQGLYYMHKGEFKEITG